jgi:putative hemolysin
MRVFESATRGFDTLGRPSLVQPIGMLLCFSVFLVLCGSGLNAARNPAAVYCRALGFTYSVQQTPEGERGVCRLPDQTEVGAWEFLQGKVAQEYSICRKLGRPMMTVTRSSHCTRLHSDECAVCILEDQTQNEVTRLMGLTYNETVCGDGSCGIPENSQTCPDDCPSGGSDGLCDALEDGVVDPDCAWGEDPDQKRPLDIDGNGTADALTDGLLVLRYLFGMRGADLVSNAIGADATRQSAQQIEAHFDDIGEYLDVDANQSNDALTDGLLILRYLFGFRENGLVEGAIGSEAERTTSGEIEDYLADLI